LFTFWEVLLYDWLVLLLWGCGKSETSWPGCLVEKKCSPHCSREAEREREREREREEGPRPNILFKGPQ
jgi:hypothetical protein